MTQDNQTFEYAFTLVLTGIKEVTPEIADSLLQSACDDATIAIRSGRPFITFSRRAASLKDAIIRAIEDVRNANVGADVLRVDYCNLVTQADIARKIGRTRQLVHQYMSGERGPGGFPPPVCGIVDEAPLWRWCEVVYWLRQNNMVREEMLRDAEEIETINMVLDLMWQKAMNPDLAAQVIQSISPGICH